MTSKGTSAGLQKVGVSQSTADFVGEAADMTVGMLTLSPSAISAVSTKIAAPVGKVVTSSTTKATNAVKVEVKAAFVAEEVVEGAAKTGTTAFKSFTKSNYRHNLQVLTGKSGAGMDAHHIFPQASRFQQHWDRVGINIHDPKNLTWWQSGAHRSAAGDYNKAWDLFFEKNPQATLQQIQNFGNSLMKSHGF